MSLFLAVTCAAALLPPLQSAPPAARAPVPQAEVVLRTPIVSLAERKARAEALFAELAALPAPAADTPPNVILLLLDDVGVDRLSCFDALNGDPAPTPFLDVVAEQGLVFDRAYAQPVCSPSRMGALTGLNVPRTGVGNVFLWANTQNDPYLPDPDALATLPKQVRATGTHAAVAVGKWHMNNLTHAPDPFLHPIDFGFQEFRGSMTSVLLSESYYEYPYTVATAAGAHTAVETTYATTKQIDDALDVVERLGNQPFLLWFSLHAPHTPWEAPPQALVSSVDVDDLTTENQLFKAMLEAADMELLRFFEELRPAVLARTVVLIAGDNGTPGSSLGLPFPQPFNTFKGGVGEGGIHVPLLAWRKGIGAGRTDALVHLDDFYATTLELVDGDASAGLDSVSFAPVLAGAPGTREFVYSARHVPNGGGPYTKNDAAVVGDGWKLQRTDATVRLFRLLGKANSQFLVQPPYDAEEQAQFDALLAVLQEMESPGD